MGSKTKKIGIYAGTFDPVHAGHVSFALQALQTAGLDAVYFLPERRPRGKKGVEHFGHRVAMLKKAVRPHRKLKVLELEDVSFTVRTSLPRLQKQFPNAEFSFLFGSDVVPHIASWPYANRLLTSYTIIAGLRHGHSQGALQQAIADWPITPTVIMIQSQAADVSSRLIREALRERRHAPGLLRCVQRYSDRNWLYISVA